MSSRRLMLATAAAALALNGVLYLLASSMDVFWRVDRSAGEVTLLLMTAAVVLGIVRAGAPGWNPSVVEGLHVDVALLTIAFGAVHILSTILSETTSLGPIDSVVPFVAGYRGSWVGLGVISVYLYLAAMLTSWPLRRLPRPWWSWVHRSIYLGWALTLVHALGAGSDSRSAIYVALDVAAVLAVIAAIAAVGMMRRRSDRRLTERSPS